MNNIRLFNAFITASIIGIFSIFAAAQQITINGPQGSEFFGVEVAALPNGNIVVTDPFYDAPGPISNVGAVYLYDGSTGALISTITGSMASDRIGNAGITVLPNGNYLIKSPLWRAVDGIASGAVTFGDSENGVSGVVSAANSLIGLVGDMVGSGGVVVLPNSNYAVISQFWNGNSFNIGAVTLGNGNTGTSGEVSAANSLVGSTGADRIGSEGVTVLKNGNYVVISPQMA